MHINRNINPRLNFQRLVCAPQAGVRGKPKENTEPYPNWLVTSILPLCASTIALTIARPIPWRDISAFGHKHCRPGSLGSTQRTVPFSAQTRMSGVNFDGRVILVDRVKADESVSGETLKTISPNAFSVIARKPILGTCPEPRLYVDDLLAPKVDQNPLCPQRCYVSSYPDPLFWLRTLSSRSRPR